MPILNCAVLSQAIFGANSSYFLKQSMNLSELVYDPDVLGYYSNLETWD
jgi:hypothetical protein